MLTDRRTDILSCRDARTLLRRTFLGGFQKSRPTNYRVNIKWGKVKAKRFFSIVDTE